MAFIPANAPAASASSSDWKADAFLNFYLPTSDGGRRKVGAIPLRNSKGYEAALIKKLASDPEAAQKMMNVLLLDFQLANQPVSDDVFTF